MDNRELNHAGIKGMKWGVRRYQNKDGSLTPAGKKRYGETSTIVGTEKRKKQSRDWLPEKSERQKRWEDDHGIRSDRPNGTKPEPALNIKAELKRKAKQTATKVSDKVKQKATKENVQKTALKGAKVAAKLANAAMMDQVITGGAGRRVVKETTKQPGRAVVTAYTMARGGYDIRWYDK